MLKQRLKIIFISLCVIGFLSLTVLSIWLLKIDSDMSSRIAKGWFLPPLEIYSQPVTVFERQQLTAQQFVQQLKLERYRERNSDQKLFPGDYSVFNSEQCSEIENLDIDNIQNCVLFQTPINKFGPLRNSKIHLLAFDERSVKSVFSGSPLTQVKKIQLPPKLFAQFYGGKPILRKVTPIEETPMACLHATTAIEDSKFLEHKGVIFTNGISLSWLLGDLRRLIA